MALDDVWRNINREMTISWRGQFDSVPALPGVYAWFYPLRILTKNLAEFVAEVSRVMCFDARDRSAPSKSLSVEFTWDVLDLTIKKVPREFKLSESLSNVWDDCVHDPVLFERLRETVMRSSILMPLIDSASNTSTANTIPMPTRLNSSPSLSKS